MFPLDAAAALHNIYHVIEMQTPSLVGRPAKDRKQQPFPLEGSRVVKYQTACYPGDCGCNSSALTGMVSMRYSLKNLGNNRFFHSRVLVI